MQCLTTADCTAFPGSTCISNNTCDCAIPTGPYQSTCTDCQEASCILSCDCDGSPFESAVQLPCATTILDCAEQLECATTCM